MKADVDETLEVSFPHERVRLLRCIVMGRLKPLRIYTVFQVCILHGAVVSLLTRHVCFDPKGICWHPIEDGIPCARGLISLFSLKKPQKPGALVVFPPGGERYSA